MVFDEVVAALNLWDRLRNWHRGRLNPPVESVASRFIRLFESHGVHRNQIPRFFGHGIKLQDLNNEASLLVKLDEVILDAACKHFAVRREWLDGAESQVHPCHDFYKEPENFLNLIKTLRANNPEGDLHGVLIAPAKNDWNAEALLILEESIGFIGDKPIYRFHICNNWTFTYWKSRAYLVACIAMAWKSRIFVNGTYAPNKLIKGLAEGKTLLGWKGDGIGSFGVKRWDPEDMALRPEAFLHSIDPERNNFGFAAGLRLWLELEQQGLMSTGFDKKVRPLFQQELAKYETQS
jgi:hypothetical protein